MLLIWLQFSISALIIIVSGARLCRYANIISEKVNLSKIWIGLILLGIVTSLPELVTSLALSINLGAFDLALGDLLGSNNFNLLIIVVLDFLYKTGSITNQAGLNRSHIFSASWLLVLSAIVLLSIIANSQIKIFTVSNIGIGSILIAVVYIIAIRLISGLKKEKPYLEVASHKAESSTYKEATLAKACLGFFIASIFVVTSGIWLANIGVGIVQLTGWKETFVGAIFLAMVTSFPELVVSISAFRLGSIDMAFGNIFGSNMINLFVIPIIDIIYRKGAILSLLSQSQIITATLMVFVTCVIIIGFLRRRKKTFFNLGWDTSIVLAAYFFGNYMLFRLK